MVRVEVRRLTLSTTPSTGSSRGTSGCIGSTSPERRGSLEIGPTDRGSLEDVIAEWAALLDSPIEVVTTGDIEGRYRSGSGGDTIGIDTIELARVLAGRARHDHPAFERKMLF